MNVFALLVGISLLWSTPLSARKPAFLPEPFGPGVEYDRLDGRGQSGIKVDVIEWAGNMELHVYPGGSLIGLSLTLDDKNKKKPIMIVGYRFKTYPRIQVIRRSLVTMPLRAGFKAYMDQSIQEYDKVVISNNVQAGTVRLLALEDSIDRYPSGHPKSKFQEIAKKKNQKKRVPAARSNPHGDPSQHGGTKHLNQDGQIRPYDFR